MDLNKLTTGDKIIGISGILELTALLFWAAVLWRGLLGQVPRPVEIPAGAPVGRS